jgi:hypothetical protein
MSRIVPHIVSIRRNTLTKIAWAEIGGSPCLAPFEITLRQLQDGFLADQRLRLEPLDAVPEEGGDLGRALPLIQVSAAFGPVLAARGKFLEATDVLSEKPETPQSL